MSAGLLVDAALGLILVGLALQVISGHQLFRSIVFYVAFGLVMAMIWARLGALDLALADAALGAGLVGALMMVAFRRLVEFEPVQTADAGARDSTLVPVVALLSAALVAALGFSALPVADIEGRAGELALARLDELGLGNPVAAVVLVFRGFDTLIEMLVLLTAYLGARVVAEPRTRLAEPVQAYELPLVRSLLAVIVPIVMLVAFNLLWIGADHPGGAFQAGSMLAAAGVLLLLTGRLLPVERSTWLTRLALMLGVAALLLLVLAPMLAGHVAMAYAGRGALLAAEAAMMMSITLTLTLLFAGAPAVRVLR
ncbi:MAG: hydrogenase subunit MbhD domain-containing protein [Wenzhouxiangellaceae bacterium]|nr:hydrogenase subunit MbhD domain-containing protein [Wenzhouxiangellaceae bacterium]